MVEQQAGRWDGLERIAATAEADRHAGRITIALRATGPGCEPERWDRQGDAVLLSASTIKVAILVAVARALDAGTLRHDQRLAARPVDSVSGSGVLKALEPGLSLTLDDHAWLMIAISDNTASNVLIEAAGRSAVQAAMEDLGCTGSHLRRAFLGAIPTDDLPRNETTASDLVRLLSAIADDQAASPERCEWMRGLLGQQQHLDRLGRSLPAGITFRGKSGSLEGTVHDCAILDGPGGQVVIAVLTSGVTDRYAVDAVLGQLARAAVDASGIAG
ncbi:MAG TPA: serine hydrolase [Thermomicrobiales bacterium]|jgi:beta-lactamase class A|nr:serine hydrolase [Thermomicrobiales bacterium]